MEKGWFSFFLNKWYSKKIDHQRGKEEDNHRNEIPCLLLQAHIYPDLI
jgi:hypothetical protein